MCLGIPGIVTKVGVNDAEFAEVEVSSIRRTVHLGMVADSSVEVGDWLLIHVGFAIAKLDEDEAMRTLDFQAQSGKDYQQEIDAFASLIGGEDQI